MSGYLRPTFSECVVYRMSENREDTINEDNQECINQNSDCPKYGKERFKV